MQLVCNTVHSDFITVNACHCSKRSVLSAYDRSWGAGGGVYYKGTVTHVRQQMPSGGINLMGRGDYDPWEALEVEWDVGGDAEGMDHVSPWEIEVCSPASSTYLQGCRNAKCVYVLSNACLHAELTALMMWLS